MLYKEPVDRYVETTTFLSKNLDRPINDAEVSMLQWLSTTDYMVHYVLMGLFEDLTKNGERDENNA